MKVLIGTLDDKAQFAPQFRNRGYCPTTGKLIDEVWEVFVTDCPAAPSGKLRRVGYCGPQAGSGMAPIGQHGLLGPEIEQVLAAVKEWQAKQTNGGGDAQ